MMAHEAFLITEFCSHDLYNGWHIYLRDNKNRKQRNVDGGWGWLQRTDVSLDHAHRFLATLGIEIKGDGTCDDDGYAEVARRYPIPRQRVGGKPRGCIPVTIGDDKMISPRESITKP